MHLCQTNFENYVCQCRFTLYNELLNNLIIYPLISRFAFDLLLYDGVDGGGWKMNEASDEF